jgi:hypothetical protein
MTKRRGMLEEDNRAGVVVGKPEQDSRIRIARTG